MRGRCDGRIRPVTTPDHPPETSPVTALDEQYSDPAATARAEDPRIAEASKLR
jgi:hypothetical protein